MNAIAQILITKFCIDLVYFLSYFKIIYLRLENYFVKSVLFNFSLDI